MTPTNVIIPCLFIALASAYTTAWFLNPQTIEHPLVTIPPLHIEPEPAQVVAFGGCLSCT